MDETFGLSETNYLTCYIELSGVLFRIQEENLYRQLWEAWTLKLSFETILKKIEKINPYNDQNYYSLDDVGFSHLFSDTFKNYARFCPTANRYYTYNGTVWKLDERDTETAELCKTFVKAFFCYS